MSRAPSGIDQDRWDDIVAQLAEDHVAGQHETLLRRACPGCNGSMATNVREHKPEWMLP